MKTTLQLVRSIWSDMFPELNMPALVDSEGKQIALYHRFGYQRCHCLRPEESEPFLVLEKKGVSTIWKVSGDAKFEFEYTVMSEDFDVGGLKCEVGESGLILKLKSKKLGQLKVQKGLFKMVITVNTDDLHKKHEAELLALLGVLMY